MSTGSTARLPPEAVRSTLQRSLFFISWPFFLIGLLLPVYGLEIGADVVQIGLFFSAFSLMTVVLRPLVGRGLDWFGRRPFFVLGLAGYALAMVSFAYADQVWAIIAARVMQGVASSFMWLAAYATTADVSVREQRGRAFGNVIQASTRGSIVGVFVGFTLLNATFHLNEGAYEIGGWTTMFLAFALVGLYALFLAWRRLPETKPEVTHETAQRISWSRPWLLLLLVTLVTGASWAMVSPLLIIFLQERLGASVETLAWAYFPSALVWALLPSRLGALADRFGRKPLMVLGLVAAAAGSFFLPSLSSVLAFAVLWAVLALCFAAGDPAEQALVADLTGYDRRGRAYGFYAMANDLGATIGPFGGAWLYQHFGASAPFYANSFLLALCALLLVFFLHLPAGQATGNMPV
jgi:DHA1 family multidrug resistance protein-like MFS transporter